MNSNKHIRETVLILAKFRSRLNSKDLIWNGIDEYENAFFLTQNGVWNITVGYGKDFVTYRVPIKKYVGFGVLIHNHAWKPHFSLDELSYRYLCSGETFLVEPSEGDITVASSIRHFAHAVIDHRFNIMLFDHRGAYKFFHHDKPIVP